MKIVPLEKEGRYLIQTFLDLVTEYPTSRMMFTALNSIAKKSQFPKLHTSKNCKNKIKRIFFDIYKRLYLRLSEHYDPKKLKGNVSISAQTQEKLTAVLCHYDELKTKEIFLKLCYRHIGNKQKGQVTQKQMIQVYQQINKKVFGDGQFKHQFKNFKEDQLNTKNILMMNTGEQDEHLRSQKQKAHDNWDYQIQKENQLIQSRKSQVKKQNSQNQKKRSKIQQKIKPKKILPKQNQQTQHQQIVKKEQHQQQDLIKQKLSKYQDEIAKSQLKIQKRKIVKAVAPKDQIPTQIKSDEQVWTIQTQKKLCQQFLQQKNSLSNLARKFSQNLGISPIISAKDLSQRLVKIMLKSYKKYVEGCKKHYSRSFKMEDLEKFPEKYIKLYIKSSNAQKVRRKLIKLYLSDKFKLSQKQARQIYLFINQGVIAIISKQDEELVDENHFLNLLAEGNFQIQDQKRNKRPGHNSKDSEQKIIWKEGLHGKKLLK